MALWFFIFSYILYYYCIPYYRMLYIVYYFVLEGPRGFLFDLRGHDPRHCATAPRWARFPPTVLMAVHTLYAMTYHEARLIAPIPYPTTNIIIHAIISLGFLLLLTLPEPHHSGSSNNNNNNKNKSE